MQTGNIKSMALNHKTGLCCYACLEQKYETIFSLSFVNTDNDMYTQLKLRSNPLQSTKHTNYQHHAILT